MTHKDTAVKVYAPMSDYCQYHIDGRCIHNDDMLPCDFDTCPIIPDWVKNEIKMKDDGLPF